MAHNSNIQRNSKVPFNKIFLIVLVGGTVEEGDDEDEKDEEGAEEKVATKWSDSHEYPLWNEIMI